jgi:hypothetical protein
LAAEQKMRCGRHPRLSRPRPQRAREDPRLVPKVRLGPPPAARGDGLSAACSTQGIPDGDALAMPIGVSDRRALRRRGAGRCAENAQSVTSREKRQSCRVAPPAWKVCSTWREGSRSAQGSPRACVKRPCRRRTWRARGEGVA